MRTAQAFPDLLRFGREAVSASLARVAERSTPAEQVQLSSVLLAVDATCGNGHDTLFLAQSLSGLCQGEQMCAVLAFDIQQAALEATQALLAGSGLEGYVRLLLQGHEHLKRELDLLASSFSTAALLGAVMYNLGFLPRSDRQIVTRAATTLASLNDAARLLAPGGILAVHAYGGHKKGTEELVAVRAWCATLPFAEWVVVDYNVCNKPHNPETLFLAEKRALWKRE